MQKRVFIWCILLIIMIMSACSEGEKDSADTKNDTALQEEAVICTGCCLDSGKECEMQNGPCPAGKDGKCTADCPNDNCLGTEESDTAEPETERCSFCGDEGHSIAKCPHLAK